MIRDVEGFLRSHHPFSRLPERALEALSFHILIRVYREGEYIFKEGTRPLEYLYIIRKGEVVLELGGSEIDHLSEGESFGYPSLISGNPPNSSAKAVKDTILYLVPKEIFLQLIDKYEEFEHYFTVNLARKLSATVKLLRVPSQTKSLESFLTMRVKDIRLTPPVILSKGDTVLRASVEMTEKGASSVLVEGKELGIVTERDIIKKVVSKKLDPSSVRLAEIMSSPVIGVEENDFIFDAIIRMVRENIRRVAVFRDGKVVGILEDKDIILAESRNLIAFAKEIERARDADDLRYIYSRVDEMIAILLSEGLSALQIGKLISEINDRIIVRTVYLAIESIGREPPVPMTLMVLGSEGRKEQTLKTDQDNALAYDDAYPLLEGDPASYFESFGKRIIELLKDTGFPPCPGNVMVSSREWNMGISEWKSRIRKWFLRPEPENTLEVGIFFDFRNVFGDETMTEELRDFIFSELSKNDLFISYMLLDAVRMRHSGGLIGWILSRLEGSEREGIDIKKFGIFPITHGIRALSLREGIRETETVERIRTLVEKNILPEDLAEDLRESFSFLQSIRLRHQVDQIKEGKDPDNLINPGDFTRLERELLKDSLKVVRNFQDFIERRYTSHLPR